ncbi:hypothetical protein ACIXS0_09475, partial [Bacteroides fragilis]
IRKKAVFGTFQNFFLKKFCSSEKRFYNSHVLESQTNGKQVRRKTNKKIDSKKIDSKKTELKNRKAKTAESEKQKRRLHESELLSRQRVTPETTPCAFRYA